MKFKYNGRIYNPSNLEKKLKKLGITLDDIEIIEDTVKKEEPTAETSTVKLYYFINRDTGYRNCSIYNICPEGYVPCNKQEYEA